MGKKMRLMMYYLTESWNTHELLDNGKEIEGVMSLGGLKDLYDSGVEGRYSRPILSIKASCHRYPQYYFQMEDIFERDWYFNGDGKTYKLKDLMNLKEFTKDTLVWTDKMQQWGTIEDAWRTIQSCA